jgi:exosortase K
MHLGRNTIYYIISAAIFLMLRLLHGYLDTEGLMFLLKPVSALVETATGTQAVYRQGIGFWFGSLNVIIDGSCSGYNFMLITFALLAFIMYRYAGSAGFIKLAIIPACLVIAYAFTIFVNAARIVSAIKVTAHYAVRPAWLHEALGAFIYLLFLILFYLLANAICSKITHHAKPAKP